MEVCLLAQQIQAHCVHLHHDAARKRNARACAEGLALGSAGKPTIRSQAYEEMDAIRIGTRFIDRDLKTVTEQRDRLAEALERIAEYQGVDDEDPKTMSIEALHSLNQTTEP